MTTTTKFLDFCIIFYVKDQQPLWPESMKELPKDIRKYNIPNSVSNLGKKSATLLHFDRTGTYLGVFSLLHDSRSGDHQIVWVFFPNSISVKPEDRYKLLSDLRTLVENNTFSRTYSSKENNVSDPLFQKVKKICTIECEDVASPIFIDKPPHSWSQNFAYRKASNTTRTYKELVMDLYCREYRDFEAIMFVDEDVLVTNPQFTDLTDIKKSDLKVVDPKEWILNNTNHWGVKFGGQPFNQKILASESDKITIVREGFIPLETPISTQPIDFAKLNNGWKFIVKKESFECLDDKNQPINEPYTIKIKSSVLSTSLAIPESDAKSAKVVVDSASWHYEETRDLIAQLQNGGKCVLRMKKAQFTSELHFSPTDVTGDVKLVVTSTKNIVKSPIPGYTLGHNRTLVREKQDGLILFFKDPRFWIFIVLALALGVVLGCTLFGKADKTSETIEQTSQVPEQTDSPDPDKKKVEEAEAYLDGHSKWVKNNMEKIDYLKGVWDAMNTFNYVKLEEIDGQYNFNSDNWRKVIKTIKDNKDNLISEGTGGRHSFNEAGDDTITVDNYKKKIVKQSEPANSTRENQTRKTAPGNTSSSSNGTTNKGNTNGNNNAERVMGEERK